MSLTVKKDFESFWKAEWKQFTNVNFILFICKLAIKTNF